MFQDLRIGLRMLLKDKGFTVVAALTLALGIGANTAMFSVLNTYLFRALPYPNSDQLARLILLGVLLGFGGAYAVARFLASAIPTLPTRDPVAMGGIALALVAVALAACYLPARRATKVDPMVALRHE